MGTGSDAELVLVLLFPLLDAASEEDAGDEVRLTENAENWEPFGICAGEEGEPDFVDFVFLFGWLISEGPDLRLASGSLGAGDT